MYSQAMKFSSAEPVGLLHRGMCMLREAHKKFCVETFAFEHPSPFRCVQKFFKPFFLHISPAKSCMATGLDDLDGCLVVVSPWFRNATALRQRFRVQWRLVAVVELVGWFVAAWDMSEIIFTMLYIYIYTPWQAMKSQDLWLASVMIALKMLWPYQHSCRWNRTSPRQETFLGLKLSPNWPGAKKTMAAQCFFVGI